MTLSQSDLPTLIRAKKTFKCGNVFAEFRNGIYAAYSYGHHFPLIVCTEDGKWLINMDKFSPSTSRQQARAVPTPPGWKHVSTEDAIKVIEVGTAEARRERIIRRVTTRLEHA